MTIGMPPSDSFERVGNYSQKTAQPASLEQLNTVYTEWANSLTPEEKGAFKAYRTPGVYYILNHFLRQGKLPAQKPWQRFDPDSLRNLAHLLTTAINKAPALKEPMVVYRSMVLPDRLRVRQGRIKGQWLEERAFLSTTADMGILKNFEQKRLTKPDKNHLPVCMKITIPAGTKVAYIEPAMGTGFTEHEVLFPLGAPNGHSMQFTSNVEDVDGLPTVEVKFVPNGARANWHPPFPATFHSSGFELKDHFDS